MRNLTIVAVLAMLVSAPTWAATKTPTLSVPGMTCAACPITVQTALARVADVSKVDVVFAKREARARSTTPAPFSRL